MNEDLNIMNALDDDLVDKGVSINSLTKGYAEFIHALLADGKFEEISNTDLAYISRSLEEAIDILNGRIAGEQKPPYVSELLDGGQKRSFQSAAGRTMSLRSELLF